MFVERTGAEAMEEETWLDTVSARTNAQYLPSALGREGLP